MDTTTEIKATLAAAGVPIGPNDAAIAEHTITVGTILVTNNTRELERVPDRWKTGGSKTAINFVTETTDMTSEHTSYGWFFKEQDDKISADLLLFWNICFRILNRPN